jgi:hypothetical protein
VGQRNTGRTPTASETDTGHGENAGGSRFVDEHRDCAPPQQLYVAATTIVLYAMATMNDNYSSADQRQHPQTAERAFSFPIPPARPARLNA